MRWRAKPELRRFLRRLPLALLAAVVLWALAKPAYGHFLAAVTQALARATEKPRAAVVKVDGNYAMIGRTDFRAGSGWLKTSLVQVHYNLVPFLTLVLALPGSLAGRGWRRLVLALAVMVLAHVLGLLWQLKCFYAFDMGPWSEANYSVFARNVYGSLRYFWDLPVTFTLPLLLWLGFFADRTLPLVGLDGTATSRRT
jgi:hypothetical protein